MNELIENMDYDNKIARPTRYVEVITYLANVASKAKDPDLFLASIDAATTPEILSFSDQLSKEAAEQLRSINDVVKKVSMQRNEAMSVQTQEMGKGMGSM